MQGPSQTSVRWLVEKAKAARVLRGTSAGKKYRHG